VSDDERSGSCIVQPCARDPHPDLVPVCGPHRSRLAGQLRDIPHLVEELKSPPEAEPARDLVSVAFPAAAIAGQSNAPRVQGSREAPIPINVDRLDLLGPADPRTVHDLSGDQIGYPSAATVLDGWCAMFAEERRESVPTPRPADQSRWLLDRLDELFKHPAVDECAKEIGDLWHVLRRACGLTMPQPQLCEGVPCKSIDCDLKTLYRVPGSDFVECASCGRLYTATDYADWVRLVAAAAKGRKTA
jgi:hypothetical protein